MDALQDIDKTSDTGSKFNQGMRRPIGGGSSLMAEAVGQSPGRGRKATFRSTWVDVQLLASLPHRIPTFSHTMDQVSHTSLLVRAILVQWLMQCLYCGLCGCAVELGCE